MRDISEVGAHYLVVRDDKARISGKKALLQITLFHYYRQTECTV